MANDIKIFNACDHIVDDEIYQKPLCPRCYGKGYYFDIHFDISGQAVLTNGSIKLQQEVLKILIDKKFTNIFHPNWGSQINNLIGSKNLNINKSKLEIIIRNTLEYLKNVQINEARHWNNLSEEEIIDKILYIDITSLGHSGYNIEVMISNQVGNIYKQTITL